MQTVAQEQIQVFLKTNRNKLIDGDTNTDLHWRRCGVVQSSDQTIQSRTPLPWVADRADVHAASTWTWAHHDQTPGSSLSSALNQHTHHHWPKPVAIGTWGWLYIWVKFALLEDCVNPWVECLAFVSYQRRCPLTTALVRHKSHNFLIRQISPICNATAILWRPPVLVCDHVADKLNHQHQQCCNNNASNHVQMQTCQIFSNHHVISHLPLRYQCSAPGTSNLKHFLKLEIPGHWYWYRLPD